MSLTTSCPKLYGQLPVQNQSLAENIFEVVEARLARDPLRRQHRSFRERAPRLHFVRQHDSVAARRSSSV